MNCRGLEIETKRIASYYRKTSIHLKKGFAGSVTNMVIEAGATAITTPRAYWPLYEINITVIILNKTGGS